MKHTGYRMMLTLMCAALLGSFPAMAGDDAQTEMQTEGQGDTQQERTATIRVVSITGNKMTYIEEADTQTAETEEAPNGMGENETAAEESIAQTEAMTEDGKAQSTGFPGGGFPGGDVPDGGFPDGGFPGGEMPSGSFPGGEMPSRSFPGGDEQSFGADQQGNIVTTYINVAVPVHTGVDEVRTFTILQAGDTLEVTLMKNDVDEEVITEIWIRKTSEAD